MKTLKKQEEEELAKQRDYWKIAFMFLLFVFILELMFFYLHNSKTTDIAGIEIKEKDLNNFIDVALKNNQNSIIICELEKYRCIILTDLKERLK